MKFLHTADWQIGMKAASVGSAAQKVRDERLAAGRRLVNAATAEGVAFILVAGDLFEDNAVDRIFVQKTADILARFNGPVYLIPGNHDPLVPGSVWEHPAWRAATNLHVLSEEQLVDVPGGVLFPCPIRDKYARKDPTSWIQGERGKTIRLGIAHGNVEGLVTGDMDHPIARNAPDQAGLDYLALGHWHSTATYPDLEGVVRMAYSGTPESTRFGERDSGNVLLVEIVSSGAAPLIRPVRTGNFRWESIKIDAREPGDLSRALQEIQALADPNRILLDLHLEGLLHVGDNESLSRMEDLLNARFLFARMDISALRPAPDDTSWIDALPAGVLREAAGRLRQTATSGGEDAEVASRALLELYAIAGEVSQ